MEREKETSVRGKPTVDEPLLLHHQRPVLVPFLVEGLLKKEAEVNEGEEEAGRPPFPVVNGGLQSGWKPTGSDLLCNCCLGASAKKGSHGRHFNRNVGFLIF